MKRIAWLLVLLLTTACSVDREAGTRFQLERELWQADWEYRNLTIRPQDVGQDKWAALAAKFEAIAAHYATSTSPGQGGEARLQIQTMAARSLFAAARVYGQLRDSTRVEQIYENMARDFAHLPGVAGEVAAARGSIAESRGRLIEAADLYQQIVDRVQPDPQDAGVAGVVLSLPIRIARLRAQASSPTSSGDSFRPAREYYERVVANSSDELTRLEAEGHLAEIMAYQGQWQQAIASLRSLESKFAAMESPPREPAEARLAIASMQARSGDSPETVHQTLASILTDYPTNRVVPQVLLALAMNANVRGQVDEAVGYMDKIMEVAAKNEDLVASTLLERARLLESRDRWPDALASFRLLSSQHPLSEAALTAPLEIAKHYSRMKDRSAEVAALAQAEQAYRDFIAKYPPGPLTAYARERLVHALALQQKYDPAVQEMVGLGDDLAGSPRGASLLIAAAGIAAREFSDTLRAVSILEHTGELYKNEGVGDWARNEAARLKVAHVR